MTVAATAVARKGRLAPDCLRMRVVTVLAPGEGRFWSRNGSGR